LEQVADAVRLLAAERTEPLLALLHPDAVWHDHVAGREAQRIDGRTEIAALLRGTTPGSARRIELDEIEHAIRAYFESPWWRRDASPHVGRVLARLGACTACVELRCSAGGVSEIVSSFGPTLGDPAFVEIAAFR
jgi:hypothetical protein